MKWLFSMVVLGVAGTAQASWYQTHCSNGEGTTRYAEGHNENQVVLTERVWRLGELVDTRIVLELGDALVEELTTGEVFSESEDGSGREVTYRKIKITKGDESSFSANVIGVTEDRKAVEAYVICEHNFTSEVETRLFH